MGLDWNHFFFPIGVGRLHAYSKHPNIKKNGISGKKKGGTEEEEEERKASVFFFFSPAIALAGIHIPGKSHSLNQKIKETADAKCATSTVVNGCVQSFNHLHFQLEKKKEKEEEEEEYKHNWILSLAHWVGLIFYIFFCSLKSMPIYICK